MPLTNPLVLLTSDSPTRPLSCSSGAPATGAHVQNVWVPAEADVSFWVLSVRAVFSRSYRETMKRRHGTSATKHCTNRCSNKLKHGCSIETPQHHSLWHTRSHLNQGQLFQEGSWFSDEQIPWTQCQFLFLCIMRKWKQNRKTRPKFSSESHLGARCHTGKWRSSTHSVCL